MKQFKMLIIATVLLSSCVKHDPTLTTPATPHTRTCIMIDRPTIDNYLKVTHATTFGIYKGVNDIILIPIDECGMTIRTAKCYSMNTGFIQPKKAKCLINEYINSPHADLIRGVTIPEDVATSNDNVVLTSTYGIYEANGCPISPYSQCLNNCDVY